MAKAYVARAMRAGLSKEGEPSLLRGVSCGNVAIQRQVEVEVGSADRAYDNYVGRFDVVLIDVQYAPKVGDLLEHPDGNFTLDRLVRDNGVTAQFIVVKV